MPWINMALQVKVFCFAFILILVHKWKAISEVQGDHPVSYPYPKVDRRIGPVSQVFLAFGATKFDGCIFL